MIAPIVVMVEGESPRVFEAGDWFGVHGYLDSWFAGVWDEVVDRERERVLGVRARFFLVDGFAEYWDRDMWEACCEGPGALKMWVELSGG